jgi:HSP20 family molecular chaperone IbpA
VSEEELQIQVQDHRVTVTIVGAQEEKAETSTHRFAGFQKAFRFRTALHSEAAEARLEKGILNIHLPKAASAVPRTLTLSPSN